MNLKTVAVTMVIMATSSALAADYEVTIDGKTHLFTQGVEQRVVLNDGYRVSISVSPVKIKEFREHGLSFSYPSDMSLEQDSFFGIKQTTIESIDSILFMLQVFPEGTIPKELQHDLLIGFREEFGNLIPN